MKILIANWVYNWGSTGYILRDLNNELKSLGHEVITVCGVNKGATDRDVQNVTSDFERTIYNRLSCIAGSKFNGSIFATYKFIKIIKQTRPDVVHLHLLHCHCVNFNMLLAYLNKHRIKIVLTHHAEIYYTGGCGYAYDCNNWINNECKNCQRKTEATGSYFLGNPHRNWVKLASRLMSFNPDNLFHTTVSPWLKERFNKSSISKEYRCEVVLNGINTEIFRRRLLNTKFIDISHYILHVTANFNPSDINDIKGGYFVLQLAKRMTDKIFVVVCTNNKINQELPSNIIIWGKAKNQEELASLYTQADITLLTSKKETFSMICAESLCCGTPIVGFKAGGPESISIPRYSKFVDYGNIEKLEEGLREFEEWNIDRDEISQSAHRVYAQRVMAENYVKIYDRLINE